MKTKITKENKQNVKLKKEIIYQFSATVDVVLCQCMFDLRRLLFPFREDRTRDLTQDLALNG